MWTQWQQSSKIQQLENDQISYTDFRGELDSVRNIVTINPVRGIATSSGALVREEPNSLLFRDFGFQLNGLTVAGVEVQVKVDRLARIQDHVIQLYWNGPVGKNLADLSAEDVWTYGGSLSVWDLNSTTIDWTNENFGVIVDLQPHQSYPSNNLITIRHVYMRLDLV